MAKIVHFPPLVGWWVGRAEKLAKPIFWRGVGGAV